MRHNHYNSENIVYVYHMISTILCLRFMIYDIHDTCIFDTHHRYNIYLNALYMGTCAYIRIHARIGCTCIYTYIHAHIMFTYCGAHWLLCVPFL